MSKSALERQLQKQAREEALRQQAASIISVQKVVDGFRILDDTSETVLKILLDHCSDSNTGRMTFENSYFSPIIQKSLGLELEKLKQCGMLHVFMRLPNSGIVDLYQPAFQYFEQKEKIMQREALSTGTTIENHFHGNTNIIGADVNGSVIVAGDNNTVKSAEENRSDDSEIRFYEEESENDIRQYEGDAELEGGCHHGCAALHDRIRCPLLRADRISVRRTALHKKDTGRAPDRRICL